MEQNSNFVKRATLFFLALLVALTGFVWFSGLLYAQEPQPPDRDFVFRAPLAAELDGAKYGSKAEAEAGDTLQFTLVISNSGDSSIASVLVTDTLPAGMSYVAGTLNIPPGTIGSASSNVITWTGALMARSQVQLTYNARLGDALLPDATLHNVLEASGAGQVISRTATTTIISETFSGFVYLPIITYFEAADPPVLVASASRPSPSNRWTVSWTVSGPGASQITGYQVHESKSPDFESYHTINAGAGDTSVAIQHDAGPFNVYFYRVAAIGPWGEGILSNVTHVIGNYYDDFTNTGTDWKVRRTSYLEKTYAYYLNGNLVVLTDDKYDWVVASPLQPAPELPYAIEYRARVNDPSNLISGGAFFGGDWNGEACPEAGNVYQTDNCLNQFYNFNYIWYGAMKLLWEKVDELYWCPECGGSALKRLGETEEIDPIFPFGGEADQWHTYRIEVRSDGARLYIDGEFVKHFTDTDFIHRPYFGAFASTWEYKPSIWLYDYYKVTVLE